MPADKPTEPTKPAQRSGAMRALAAPVASVARAALGRRGFAEGGLVADWPSIVGASIAAGSVPLRLSFPAGERREGTLHVRVSGGLALELQHLEPVVIERLNGYFGYRAVARIRIQQGPLPVSPAKPRPAARLIGEAEASAIDAQVSGVGDEELRAALVGLARAVRAAPRK